MFDSLEKVINDLKAVRQKKPALADVIDLHCALLERQGRAVPAPVPVLPTPEETEQALKQGTPLLQLVPVYFDWQAVSQVATDVCRTIAEHRPDLIDSLAVVSHHLLDQNGQIEWLATRYLNGESLDTVADKGLLPDLKLLTLVLNHSLRPFLQSAIRDLQADIDSWGRPICPMCGGPPDFAALVSAKKNEVYGRQLLCARCDTVWGYQRGGCPFCGQIEQWAYFPDENEVFRLYVCDVCDHYLKTVDWRQTFAHRSLPVARVITLNMDVAAVQAGYGE